MSLFVQNLLGKENSPVAVGNSETVVGGNKQVNPERKSITPQVFAEITEKSGSVSIVVTVYTSNKENPDPSTEAHWSIYRVMNTITSEGIYHATIISVNQPLPGKWFMVKAVNGDTGSCNVWVSCNNY